jgi:hypothetical protein
MSEAVLTEEPVHLPAPTLTPLALLDKAIDRGISPDQLGKLIDLAEAWRQSRAKEAFAAALCAVQAQAPVVVKDADNTQTKSRYARLESINKKLVPVYTAHGFSLAFGEEDDPKGREGWTRIICDVTHRDGHMRTYHLDMPPEGEGIKGQRNMTLTHAKGSTLSYGRRYLVCMIANVTIANEDDDGNGGPDDSNEPAGNELLDELDGLIGQHDNLPGAAKINLPKLLAWLVGRSVAAEEAPAVWRSLTKGQWRKACAEVDRRIKAKKGGAK